MKLFNKRRINKCASFFVEGGIMKSNRLIWTSIPPNREYIGHRGSAPPSYEILSY